MREEGDTCLASQISPINSVNQWGDRYRSQIALTSRKEHELSKTPADGGSGHHIVPPACPEGKGLQYSSPEGGQQRPGDSGNREAIKKSPHPGLPIRLLHIQGTSC